MNLQFQKEYLALLDHKTMRPLDRIIVLLMPKDSREQAVFLSEKTMDRFPGLDIHVCPIEDNYRLTEPDLLRQFDWNHPVEEVLVAKALGLLPTWKNAIEQATEAPAHELPENPRLCLDCILAEIESTREEDIL